MCKRGGGWFFALWHEFVQSGWWDAREDRGFLRVISPSSSSPIGFFVYHWANSVTIPQVPPASGLSLHLFRGWFRKRYFLHDVQNLRI